MKRTLTILSLTLLLCSCGGSPVNVKPGKTLPKWKEGWLDIHSINTGRGESTLYIFPDGTTMLVDASGAEIPKKGQELACAPRPSGKYLSEKVINRYLDRYLPKESEGGIDYFMLSHFHEDHMGKTSLIEVGKAHPYRTVIDRGAPDSRASSAWFDEAGRERMDKYAKFLAWSALEYGTVHESMKVGHDDQITLLHKASKYPSFAIRNLAAGGNYWTGEGVEVDSTYMPTPAECYEYGRGSHSKAAPKINENIFSCVFQLSYGKFDWYSGGDLMYKHREIIPWFDAELPVSKVVKRTDAMKMNHHGTGGSNGPELCRALKPTVALASTWKTVQPNPATLKTLFKASPDVALFVTNWSGDDDRVVASNGHIVIRVEPGGDRYWVLALDDSNFKYRVKGVYGPYESKE